MTPGGRIFEDFSRLMTDASGLAQGVRREIETVVRGQVERLLAAMDVVLEQKLGTAATPPPGAGGMSI